VADKQQIKEKGDDVIMMMMMIMEIVFFFKKRIEEQLRYISHRTARSFFSFSLPISIFALDRLIDMMDDIFLIWQCRAIL
jgi:hypothetical protein